ncbi:MAG: MarR family transcriptional regulator [Nitrolancea sp.]
MSNTPNEELIEEVMNLLPRFRKSMFQQGGGPRHHHGRRGGPPGGPGRGRRGRQGGGRHGWGGPGAPAQMRMVMQLYRRGPAKITDIASWAGISLPTASEQIDRLVEAGMAERRGNAEDRREVLVDLSPKAIELANYVWNRQRARVERALERFTPEEQPLVVRVLEAFADVFEQDPETLTDDDQLEPEVL